MAKTHFIEYDRIIIPEKEVLLPSGETLTGLAIWIRFEQPFKNVDKDYEQMVAIGNRSSTLSSLLRVEYDDEFKVLTFHSSSALPCQFKPVAWEKQIEADPSSPTSKELLDKLGLAGLSFSEGVEIEKEEFRALLHAYKFRTERSLQSTSFSWAETY